MKIVQGHLPSGYPPAKPRKFSPGLRASQDKVLRCAQDFGSGLRLSLTPAKRLNF